MNSFRSALFALAVAALIVPSASSQTNSSQTTLDITNQAPTASPDIKLSAQATQVVKLADSNTDKSTILAFVNNATKPFDLTADDVIYLRDVGIDTEVITAMLRHDSRSDVGQTNNVAATAQSPSVATNPPPNTNAVSYVQTNAPPDVRPFYDALAPYGTWVYIDGNWAWQPNVVVADPGWQPYSDAGQWVWSDCGWYWSSDYSWGWAPFHYGRWWRAPHWGWVWYPGTRWAPSWVTWRTYGDFCGWAPLPPNTLFVGGGFSFGDVFVGFNSGFDLGPECFTFIDFPFFFGHDFRHHRFHHDRVRDFFHRTSVVNNFSTTRNNIVINNGIPTDRVRRATGQSIRTVPVVDSNRPLRSNGSTQVVRNGRTEAVTRTALPELATSASRTFAAERATITRPITPTLPNRLTASGRRGIVQDVQNGPPVWSGQRRTILPNERQLWNNFGREQSLPSSTGTERSLVVPSQRTSRGELPTRPASPEIRDAAGAAVPRNNTGTTVTPQQSAPPAARGWQASPPPRTEIFTPRARTAPEIQQVTPRNEINLNQAGPPVQMMPRSGQVYVPPSHPVAPPSAPLMTPRQQTGGASGGHAGWATPGAWSGGASRGESVGGHFSGGGGRSGAGAGSDDRRDGGRGRF